MIRPDDARFSVAEAAFAVAAGLPPRERSALLERMCGHDEELRAYVERLLESDERPAGQVDGRVRFRPLVGLEPPFQIGGFRALRRLAEGGMGVVYEAEQERPRRLVALKILRFTLPSREHVRRFAIEAEALGQLGHPGIAQIHEAGTGEVVTAAGERMRLPFVAMELVRGAPLLEFAAARRLSVRQRLALMASICDAVSHAHQKAIIHRDLKPGNILVEESGQPKILDFGLARFAGAGEGVGGAAGIARPAASTITAAGELLGTLAYMSPEQAGATADGVDTRSDVYSLGVILFELLSGRLPHEIGGKPLADAVRTLAEAEPARLGVLDSSLRGDVETIALKALARDKGRRYQSAAEMGADVRRCLAGLPIEARRDSTLYVVRKTVRRHRWPIAAAVIFVASLTAFAGYSWRQAVIAQRERATAVSLAAFMEQTLRGVAPSVARGRDTTMLKELMDAAAHRIENGELEAAPEAEIRLRLTISEIYLELGEPQAAERLLGPALELVQRVHGAGSEQHARAVSLEAWHLESSGLAAQAVAKYEEALAIRRRLFAGDHPLTAQSLNDLGECLEGLARFAEATPLVEEALAMRRRLYAGDHPKVAESLLRLAWCVGLVSGLPYAQEALDMRRRLYAGDHPAVAQALNDVAYTLEYMARPAEALPLMQEALDMRRRLFPSDHPAIRGSLIAIRECYDSLGMHAEALSVSEESLTSARRVLPADHPGVAAGLFAVAWSLECLGRSAEARSLFEESLAIRLQRLGPNHYHVAQSLHGLGYCLVSLGEAAAAVEHFERAITIRRDHGVPDEKQSAVKFYGCGLARALIDLGRYAEAESLLAAAWEVLTAGGVPVRLGGLKTCSDGHVRLYEAWHAAEPEAGLDAKAEQWRAQLSELEQRGE